MDSKALENYLPEHIPLSKAMGVTVRSVSGEAVTDRAARAQHQPPGNGVRRQRVGARHFGGVVVAVCPAAGGGNGQEDRHSLEHDGIHQTDPRRFPGDCAAARRGGVEEIACCAEKEPNGADYGALTV